MYRCNELTEKLVEDYKLGTLWDNWGIVGNVVVSYSLFLLPFVFPPLHSISHYYSHNYMTGDNRPSVDTPAELLWMWEGTVVAIVLGEYNGC